MEKPESTSVPVTTSVAPQKARTFSARTAAVALHCSDPKCANDTFSDSRYGKGLRLHNAMQGKKSGFRCTGCKTER